MEDKNKVQNEEGKAQGSSKFEHFFDGGRHDHESIKKIRTSFRVETATCVKLAIAVFAVYLAIRYWPQVAKFIVDIFDSAETLIIGAIIAFLVVYVASKAFVPTSSIVYSPRRILPLALPF